MGFFLNVQPFLPSLNIVISITKITSKFQMLIKFIKIKLFELF